MEIISYVAVAVCFLFTFINGFHDGCNVIATIISSRAIAPVRALWIACIAEFSGSMLLGTGVALTIGKGVINFDSLVPFGGKISVLALLSAMSAAIIWNLITWWVRMPSSSSHALIGGLLGGGLSVCGIRGINWENFLYKVVLVLFTSPIIGFVAGYIFLRIVVKITRNMHPRTNNSLKVIQIFSMFTLGMSHGSNDSQKTMGFVAMILLLSGQTAGNFHIPLWVQATSAAMIALGLSAGGWRLIKTVGSGIFNVKPIHSFASQVSSAATIIVALLIGGPVSSSQIVNSSIMGVGTAERKNAVRWDTVKNILISWACTIPASAVIAAMLFFVCKAIMGI